MVNYLGIVSLTKGRLAEQVSDLERVTALASEEQLEDYQEQRTPAAAVIYQGDTAEAVDAGGAVTQQFLVALAVRDASDTASGASAQDKVGALMSKAVCALRGWRPSSAYGEIAFRGAKKTPYAAGYVLGLLHFQVPLALS